MSFTVTSKSSEKTGSSHLSRDGINIATFDHEGDAQNLQAVLEREGVDAWVQDERRLQRYWFVTCPQAGIHVRVPEDNVTLAQQRLETNPDAMKAAEKAVRCPSCQSTRVEYPAMTRKNVLPTLVAQIGVMLRFVKNHCYCENCHYTWVREAPDNVQHPTARRQP